MKHNLNTETKTTTFRVAGNVVTINRTRPTRKTRQVGRVDRYFAKHVRTS